MSVTIPTAVKTTRQLENKETGLDLSVSDFSFSAQSKSDIFKTRKVNYQLVIGMKIHTATTTEGQGSNAELNDDVVHFTKEKTFPEFLKLRNDLEKKYSGTYVPEISKKKRFTSSFSSSSLSTREESRESQKCLDKFMKWCAITPKIAKSSILLEFLEVKLKQPEPEENEKGTTQESKGNSDIAPIKSRLRKKQIIPEEELFDEVDFAGKSGAEMFTANALDDETVSNLFSNQEKDDSEIVKAGLFEKPELTGNISIEEKELIILSEDEDNDVIAPSSMQIIQDNKEEAEDGDLLNVTEDISAICSQMKKIQTEKKISPLPKLASLEIPASVEVENMADEDLLNYVNENSSEVDNLDLGF